MYIQLFPIYGFNVGINYWDTDMSEDHPEGEPKEYLIQFMFGIIGISVHWWKN
jgi:hypothetical protein